MSTEKLLESRKLDVEVAEKVMGIPFLRKSNGEPIHDLPFFSTDPAAMMQVVERMAQGFILVRLELHDANRKEWYCGIGENVYGIAFEATADSAPLAVVLAALSAVEGKCK